MGSNWARVQVSKLIEDGELLINDGYRAKNTELSSEGLPFARAQNVNGGFRFDDEVDRFPEKDLRKVGVKVSQPGDVVFTSKGTVGRFAYVRADTPCFVYSPQLCFWRSLNHQKLHPQWLFYWMHSKEFFEQYSGVAGQTDMAEYVSLRDQRRMHITVPPIDRQRAIACILGSLDDKIELNRRMNRTLEEMARAIFKSWFIDFDPVRAKAAVRREHPKWTDEQVSRAACPKLKPEIARLFPDSFEDSELGEIPKGWRVGTFGDIAEHQRRGVQPDSIERHTPYIGLEHMPRRSITLSEWSDADGLQSNKFRFKQGEILFGKLRPYFHKVGVAPVDGVCSTDIVVVTPRQQGWFGFVLGHACSERFIKYTNAGSTGTKMPRTSWADMARYKLSVPPEPVTATFTELVQLSIDRIVASIQESRTSAALRDALLPKLISGELRIPDAERIAQRCA